MTPTVGDVPAPRVGDIVLYRTSVLGDVEEEWVPAIVTAVESDRWLRLTYFPPGGHPSVVGADVDSDEWRAR